MVYYYGLLRSKEEALVYVGDERKIVLVDSVVSFDILRV